MIVGTAASTVAVAAYGTAFCLLAAPVVAPFEPIELGIWQPDTWFEGLLLVPLGRVLPVAAGWLS